MKLNHFVCPHCGHDFYDKTSYATCDACGMFFYVSQSRTCNPPVPSIRIPSVWIGDPSYVPEYEITTTPGIDNTWYRAEVFQ